MAEVLTTGERSAYAAGTQGGSMTSGAVEPRLRSASTQRARRLTAILDLVARQRSVTLADLTSAWSGGRTAEPR